MKFKKIKFGKPIGVCALLCATAYFGDKYDFIDRVVNPMRYSRLNVEAGFYQQPFNLKKKYVFNENGNLEVYLSDRKSEVCLPIKENMHVGKNWENIAEEVKEDLRKIRKWYKSIEDELKEKTASFKKRVEKWYNEQFGGEDYGYDKKDM